MARNPDDVWRGHFASIQIGKNQLDEQDTNRGGIMIVPIVLIFLALCSGLEPMVQGVAVNGGTVLGVILLAVAVWLLRRRAVRS